MTGQYNQRLLFCTGKQRQVILSAWGIFGYIMKNIIQEQRGPLLWPRSVMSILFILVYIKLITCAIQSK